MTPLRTTTLPSGEAIPVLGQGTYRLGEDRSKRRAEVRALQLGIELGMTLIDTAEMYADGGAEEVVGEAIAGRRGDVFLVSKFYPQHATREGMVDACERSLRRLGVDHLDLYLLHWRGSVPLRATLAGFDELLHAGKIRHAGVSNFDLDDMRELRRARSRVVIAADQVLYNLERRGIEWDLLPWCRERGVPVMAYSPLEEGLLSHRAHRTLATVAARHRATPAQVALAWILGQPGVVAIPKAARVAHVRENRAAAELKLSKADRDALDGSFPGPSGPKPLESR